MELLEILGIFVAVAIVGILGYFVYAYVAQGKDVQTSAQTLGNVSQQVGGEFWAGTQKAWADMIAAGQQLFESSSKGASVANTQVAIGAASPTTLRNGLVTGASGYDPTLLVARDFVPSLEQAYGKASDGANYSASAIAKPVFEFAYTPIGPAGTSAVALRSRAIDTAGQGLGTGAYSLMASQENVAAPDDLPVSNVPTKEGQSSATGFVSAAGGLDQTDGMDFSVAAGASAESASRQSNTTFAHVTTAGGLVKQGWDDIFATVHAT